MYKITKSWSDSTKFGILGLLEYIGKGEKNMKPNESDWLYMIKDTGELGQELFNFYHKTEKQTALDAKTHQLVYIAYLASAGIVKGVAKHTKQAKSAGATREEIQSVFTCGWAVGAARLSECYHAAMTAYDEQ